MSRPAYETEADLDNERWLAEVIEQAWRVKATKLPKRYEIDYALARDGVVKAYAELKRRRIPSTKYDTVILSAAKITKAMLLARYSGVPAYFIVQYDDGILYVDLALDEYELRIGGRSDRDDDQDIEVVAHIPIAEMKRLKA